MPRDIRRTGWTGPIGWPDPERPGVSVEPVEIPKGTLEALSDLAGLDEHSPSMETLGQLVAEDLGSYLYALAVGEPPRSANIKAALGPLLKHARGLREAIEGADALSLYFAIGHKGPFNVEGVHSLCAYLEKNVDAMLSSSWLEGESRGKPRRYETAMLRILVRHLGWRFDSIAIGGDDREELRLQFIETALALVTDAVPRRDRLAELLRE